jgi:hypothetical protein
MIVTNYTDWKSINESDNDYIIGYHGSLEEDHAISMMETGWDINKARLGGSVEGRGMGMFLNRDQVGYGNYIIEFKIPAEIIRHNILITSYGMGGEQCDQLKEMITKWKDGKSEWDQLKEIDPSLSETDQWSSEGEFNELLASDSTRLTGSIGNSQIIKGYMWDGRFAPNMPLLHMWDPSVLIPNQYYEITWKR